MIAVVGMTKLIKLMFVAAMETTVDKYLLSGPLYDIPIQFSIRECSRGVINQIMENTQKIMMENDFQSMQIEEKEPKQKSTLKKVGDENK